MSNLAIANISFTNAGYGHVKVSATINGTYINYITDDTKITDAASDEDSSNYESAMFSVKSSLINHYKAR